jgi:hypothetical protein
MDQKIIAPNDIDIDRIARALIAAQDLIFEISGRKHTYGEDDLDTLQIVIDSGKIEHESTFALQSLGLHFGKIFIENNKDYDWWIVDDDDGRDPCVRYKKTSLIFFPQTMISKRIEDKKTCDVRSMYFGLKERMEEIKSEHYKND